MDIPNNQGEKVVPLTTAVSNDQSIMINRLHDVTIVSTRDRNIRTVTTETSVGYSRYGN
jgi:hypothetical protein